MTEEKNELSRFEKMLKMTLGDAMESAKQDAKLVGEIFADLGQKPLFESPSALHFSQALAMDVHLNSWLAARLIKLIVDNNLGTAELFCLRGLLDSIIDNDQKPVATDAANALGFLSIIHLGLAVTEHEGVIRFVETDAVNEGKLKELMLWANKAILGAIFIDQEAMNSIVPNVAGMVSFRTRVMGRKENSNDNQG